MKTRQEMIYDFMIALSGNASEITGFFKDPLAGIITPRVMAEAIYAAAEGLADQYLKEL